MMTRALPALAAVVALTACGTHAATTSSTAAAPATTAAASCHDQYQAWKTGAGKAKAKQLVKALDSLQSAGEDLVLMTDALKRSARIAHQLQAYPIPRCADPAGYWRKTLADIRAGGDNASTSSGLAAVILAMAPLKEVPPLERKLTAELKKTTAS
jgi:hypothetical protein